MLPSVDAIFSIPEVHSNEKVKEILARTLEVAEPHNAGDPVADAQENVKRLESLQSQLKAEGLCTKQVDAKSETAKSKFDKAQAAQSKVVPPGRADTKKLKLSSDIDELKAELKERQGFRKHYAEAAQKKLQDILAGCDTITKAVEDFREKLQLQLKKSSDAHVENHGKYDTAHTHLLESLVSKLAELTVPGSADESDLDQDGPTTESKKQKMAKTDAEDVEMDQLEHEPTVDVTANEIPVLTTTVTATCVPELHRLHVYAKTPGVDGRVIRSNELNVSIDTIRQLVGEKIWDACSPPVPQGTVGCCGCVMPETLAEYMKIVILQQRPWWRLLHCYPRMRQRQRWMHRRLFTMLLQKHLGRQGESGAVPYRIRLETRATALPSQPQAAALATRWTNACGGSESLC